MTKNKKKQLDPDNQLLEQSIEQAELKPSEQQAVHIKSELIDDGFQQQILFDELTTEIPEQDNPDNGQVFFSNQDYQAIELSDSNPSVEFSELNKGRPKSWLWRLCSSLVVVILAIEIGQFFIAGFSESPIIASLYALLLLAVLSLAGASLLREYLGLKQLRKQHEKHINIQALTNSDDRQSAIDFCQTINEQLACDLSESTLAHWQGITEQNYNNQELLTLYSSQVLSQVDQKALDEIAKSASESVVLITLSPLALLDMALICWRNLKLIDKIAGLYGLKLGYWSRIKLLKQVITNIVYAGASELVTDFGADMLGADLLGKLSGRLAQGMGAGLLTARLGLKTIALCRPMPFNDQAPKLKDIRRSIISQAKQLISSK